MSWASLLSLAILAAPTEVAEPLHGDPTPLEVEAVGPEGPVPAWQLWQDYVRVERPRYRGTGLFIAAGATFGAGVLAQLVDVAFNDGEGSGFVDRFFIAPSMILAPLAGHFRGRYDAYMDASIGRRPRPARAFVAAGFALAALGAAGGLVNEGLWWQCWIGESGPYYREPPPDVFVAPRSCRSGLARGVLDASALMVSGGMAMALWGVKYRRDMRAYERAVFAVVPRVQQGQLGLGVVGSF
ncbi:MAG: hypothetical protein H6710_02815 [Myxococcales bacterium]|nr:hypothetical protein [Myxococcales bacterium]MCB9704000.1 hypothetical protein [Myxococcales bacterium]